MTTVLKPFFESGHDYFKSTKNRFFSVVLPIQAIKDKEFTKGKESDFASFIANPLIDCFILEPMFTLEASIHLLNAIASFAKAFYTWSITQQETDLLIDEKSAKEFGEGYSSLIHAVSALVAQTFNSILSTLSLFTRPIASLAQALNDVNEETQSTYRPSYS